MVVKKEIENINVKKKSKLMKITRFKNSFKKYLDKKIYAYDK